MKKLFFLAATACVALASCVKNEPADSVNEQQLISFASPVVGLHTKAATEISNNFPTDMTFSVWARYFEDADNDGLYYTEWPDGKVYMNEVTTSYNQSLGGWAPATSYYWPKNGTLTFIAYSPSSMADYASVGTSGIKFTDYDAYTNQVDLLFSDRAYDKTAIDDDVLGSATTGGESSVTNDVYAGVHLSFKHALSSILFTAKLDAAYADSEITLTEITLTNIYSVGTFDQDVNDAHSAITSTAFWKPKEGSEKDYTITAEQLLSTTAYYTCNASTTTPTVANGKRATDWILIPQGIGEDAMMVVKYTLKSPDSEPINQIAKLPLASTVEEWELGKRYIYNIIIGLDKIYFEPYVANWTDGTAQDFEF